MHTRYSNEIIYYFDKAMRERDSNREINTSPQITNTRHASHTPSNAKMLILLSAEQEGLPIPNRKMGDTSSEQAIPITQRQHHSSVTYNHDNKHAFNIQSYDKRLFSFDEELANPQNQLTCGINSPPQITNTRLASHTPSNTKILILSAEQEGLPIPNRKMGDTSSEHKNHQFQLPSVNTTQEYSKPNGEITNISSEQALPITPTSRVT